MARIELRLHPNSIAARKWGVTTWWTTTEHVYSLAHKARAAGDDDRASALRRRAARAGVTEVSCR